MGRVLVTGGAGFLGSYLAAALETANWEVRVLDLHFPSAPAPSGREQGGGPMASATRELIEADVRDVEAVARAARGVDVIVGNAALVPVARASSKEYFAVNVGGTEAVLRAAAQSGAYVLHISSTAIYGMPRELPITSSTPFAPVDPYSHSKLAAERAVSRARVAGQTVGLLRPRTLVGCGRLGLFDVVFARVRAGRRVPIFGDGRNSDQLCDVEDFCAAALAAIERRSGGDFNIGALDYGTVRDDIGALIAAAATGARIQPVPAWAVRGILQPLDALGRSPFTAWHYRVGPLSFYCDLTDAQRELAWRPRYSNAETLIAAYHNYEIQTAASGGSAHSRALAGGVARALRGAPAP
jgi:nucleoside-diphosphate-sugar epimerase